MTLQASRTPISRVGVLRPPTRAPRRRTPRHRPTATQRTRAGLHYRPVAAMDGPNTEQLTVTKSFRVYSIYTHQRRHNY